MKIFINNNLKNQTWRQIEIKIYYEIANQFLIDIANQIKNDWNVIPIQVLGEIRDRKDENFYKQ